MPVKPGEGELAVHVIESSLGRYDIERSKGFDPLPIMREVVDILQDYPSIELIWASPRELYNVVQASEIGCDIITATNNILRKLPTLGKDLDRFSLETVKMFYDDAKEAGYSI